jgi:[ribosomal protein S5]-alanine N-acetyltransferase
MLERIGEKIILREFSRENMHDNRYFQWLRDVDVVMPLYRTEYLLPIDFSLVEKYVENMLLSNQDAFFAIYHRSSEMFIGTFRLGHINWRSGIADVGMMIGDKEFWGQGLGTEVLSLGIEYAFNVLSLRKLIGGTPGSNGAMRRCFEKTGFKQEGIKRKELLIAGQYDDHVLYGLLKEDIYDK